MITILVPNCTILLVPRVLNGTVKCGADFSHLTPINQICSRKRNFANFQCSLAKLATCNYWWIVAKQPFAEMNQIIVEKLRWFSWQQCFLFFVSQTMWYLVVSTLGCYRYNKFLRAIINFVTVRRKNTMSLLYVISLFVMRKHFIFCSISQVKITP